MDVMDNDKEERVKVFYKDDLGKLRNKVLIIILRTHNLIKFFNEQTQKSEWINEKHISRMEGYDRKKQL